MTPGAPGIVSDLTTLIESAQRGDEDAVGRLYEALYAELHRIAHAKLRGTDSPTLLDTTALLHESFLRLVQVGRLQVSNRPHFLAYAARVMRSIIVDAARRRLSERHGGGASHVALDEVAEPAAADDSEVVRVHEALSDLAQIDPRLVRVVEMRWFAGLSDAEIAEALQLSPRTVERDWDKARIFLFAALR